MAGKLLASSIAAPGFLGINTQESGVTLASGYATKAYNCIIDKFGRLGSRRGWEMITTNNGDLPDAENIESIFEFKKVDGSIVYLSAGDGKLFSGTTTLTRELIYGADSGGPVPLVSQPAFTGNNWQFAALQEGAGASAESYAFAAQRGNTMLVYREGAHSGPFVFQQIGTYGTIPSGVSVFDPDCVHAAFGRVWVAGLSENKTTVFYSKLLDGANFSGAGSGVLDISAVVGSNDEIVAISSHNKFLVIFCKNSIVVYDNANDPTIIALADSITGVGCIARDSVQQTGTDLIFLSRSGIRSFTRTTQENSMPLRELSLNVRDELVDYLNGEVISNIKSAYFERDAFYLLTLPVSKQIVYFDLRNILENGAARVTFWDNIVYTAFTQTEDRNLLVGVTGGIGKYFGYTDNGDAYRLQYFTAPTDLGEPTVLKLLKKFSLVAIGSGQQDFIVKYAFEYSNSYSSRTFSADLGATPAYYNVDEYGVGEYTSGVAINTISVHAGGTGKVVQFGIEAVIDGAPVSVQKMDMYLVKGRVA